MSDGGLISLEEAGLEQEHGVAVREAWVKKTGTYPPFRVLTREQEGDPMIQALYPMEFLEEVSVGLEGVAENP